MEVIQIPIKEIFLDFFFCFRSPGDLSGLQRSIKMSGIRTPLYVIPKRDGFQLFSGFRRLQCARELNIPFIPAVVVQPDEIIQKFQAVLCEQLTMSGLNLIEKARVLRILGELECPFQKIKTDFFPVLNLPPKKPIMVEVMELTDLHPDVQKYIEKYDLNLRFIFPFRTLNFNAQEFFAGLGLSLTIRGLELAEIIDKTQDIAKRDNLTVEAVYLELGLPEILSREDMTRNDKIQEIKERLKSRRFPKLTEWNERLTKLNEEISIPDIMRLQWDHALEKPGVHIQTRISSNDHIQDLAKFWSDKKNQKKMESMLKIV